MELLSLERIALAAIPIILAITVHEAAHGYVARMFGDGTAWMLGRVTLNPLKHIDPVGTVLVPFATLWLGGFLFGWAKPVPVNFGNLRHPKRDMLWVAAAGPGSNFVMALAWAMVLGLASGGGPFSSAGLQYMSVVGVVINVSLMVLNLLPILPLDGGRIALSLLPRSLAIPYSNTERFGFILVIVLLVTGALGVAMRPLFGLAVTAIEAITGVDLPGGL
ncbi:MAG: site-2 protease family protein [Burkholderiales bacterium]|jgi:Zn-dependent protease|nr:site-2 protease family protein [Betaproteobacteria bacterium]MBP6564382.1 site-2 protease family protein [Burkholderiales bacterium]